MTDEICHHCKQSIAIRNPSGYCDHLYYPEYCSICCKAQASTKLGVSCETPAPEPKANAINDINYLLNEKSYAKWHRRVKQGIINLSKQFHTSEVKAYQLKRLKAEEPTIRWAFLSGQLSILNLPVVKKGRYDNAKWYRELVRGLEA